MQIATFVYKYFQLKNIWFIWSINYQHAYANVSTVLIKIRLEIKYSYTRCIYFIYNLLAQTKMKIAKNKQSNIRWWEIDPIIIIPDFFYNNISSSSASEDFLFINHDITDRNPIGELCCINSHMGIPGWIARSRSGFMYSSVQLGFCIIFLILSDFYHNQDGIFWEVSQKLCLCGFFNCFC